MKNFSFSIFNIISIVSIILLIILIALPFNLINLEQAERVAKWKTEYERLVYCFSLVNEFEGTIIPNPEETGKINSDEVVIARLIPYLNLKNDKLVSIKRYKYRKMNGQRIKKTYQFYFDKFFETKNGMLISLKQNEAKIISNSQPLYYMFIDINGIQSPNRIGQDIFFLNIYQDRVSALGSGKEAANLNANCSSISSGLYCSEYYLMGSKF